MIKTAHINAQQVSSMVGPQLASELWISRMFNEIRRYPNEIPCSNGEIPSMRIPFCSGDEKVEWGFTAGMSCLIPTDSGAIRVQGSGRFPACACLALLTLLHEAGAANGKRITVELIVPEGPQTQEFRDLLAQIQKAMHHVSICITPCEPEEAPLPELPRHILEPSRGVAVVRKLQQTDIGRFFAVVSCENGVFAPGDNVTVVDGKDRKVLQNHCPVLQVVDMTTEKEVKNSNYTNGDTFGLYYAMWFPAGTVLSSMLIVKEPTPPVHTPKKMPDRPCLRKSFLDKLKALFSK